MTRGDTAKIRVDLKYKQTGEVYTPEIGDEIVFTAINPIQSQKKIVKSIPIDTLMLRINPEDTRNLPYGQYLFDIQITFANGDVDTFITDGVLNITSEWTE